MQIKRMVTIITISIIIIAVGCLIFKVPSCFINSTKELVIATVTDKGRNNDSNGESYYLIYTDKETFKNTDCWWVGKTRSSDVYGKIQIGKTYEFEVYGWRSGFLSSYRNILSFQEIKSEEN